jgi:hypothetical protein
VDAVRRSAYGACQRAFHPTVSYCADGLSAVDGRVVNESQASGARVMPRASQK